MLEKLLAEVLAKEFITIGNSLFIIKNCIAICDDAVLKVNLQLMPQDGNKLDSLSVSLDVTDNKVCILKFYEKLGLKI